jgi:hypothetical protein
MESKAPFILILIGAILAIPGGIFHIFNVIVSKKFGETLGALANVDLSGLYVIYMILAILHIILAIVFIIYAIKISKNSTKKDFIIITILAAIGFLIAGMFFSGILILIGSIMGWVKSGKSPQKQPPKAKKQNA